MDLNAANDILRASWPGLLETISRKLACLGVDSTESMSGVLHFESAPAITSCQVEPDTLELAITAPPKTTALDPGWTAVIRGYAALPVAGSFPVPYRVILRALRIGVRAKFDHTSSFPRLRELQITPSLEAVVESLAHPLPREIAHIAVVPEGLPAPAGATVATANADHPGRFDLEVSLNPADILPGVAGAPPIKLVLLLDFFNTNLLSVKVFGIEVGLVKAPPELAFLITGLTAPEFPARFALGNQPGFVEPAVPPQTDAAMLQAAVDITTAQSQVRLAGSMFDLVNRGTVRSGRTSRSGDLLTALRGADEVATSVLAVLQPLLGAGFPAQPPQDLPAPLKTRFLKALDKAFKNPGLFNDAAIALLSQPLTSLGGQTRLSNMSRDCRGMMDPAGETSAAVRHLNQSIFDDAYGEFFDELVGSTTELRQVSGDRDSLIWTGHLLAARAFEHATRRQANDSTLPAALTRVQETLGAIQRMFQMPSAAANSPMMPECADIAPLDRSDFDGLPCRAVLPAGQADLPFMDYANPPQGAQLEFYSSTILQGAPWVGFGRGSDPPSRDQIIGALLGLGCTFQLVEDLATQTAAGEVILAFASYMLKTGWNIQVPDGDLTQNRRECFQKDSYFFQFHHQLAILHAASTVEAKLQPLDTTFRQAYAKAGAGLGPLVWLPSIFNALDPASGSYFKFNLDHAALFIVSIMGAHPTALQGFYDQLSRVLHGALSHHRNAYFNLIWIYSQPLSSRQTAWDLHSEFDPAVSHGKEIRTLLEQWLQRRALLSSGIGLMPQATPDRTVLADCLSKPAALIKAKLFGGERVVPRAALPVQLRPGSDMDFIWQRQSFATGIPAGNLEVGKHYTDSDIGIGIPYIESPGIDYVLPYWMMRYLASPAGGGIQ